MVVILIVGVYIVVLNIGQGCWVFEYIVQLQFGEYMIVFDVALQGVDYWWLCSWGELVFYDLNWQLKYVVEIID